MDEIGLRGLVAAGAVFLGSVLQGSLGFGLALVAAPVLIFLNPDWVPGALFVSGWPFVALMTWRERKHLSLQSEFPPWVGLVAGLVLGLLVLRFVEPSRLALIAAGVILLAVGLSASGVRVALNSWSRLFGGVLAGFMGATASIPGPALALLHQEASPVQMRAVLAPYFFLGNTLALAGLWATGQLSSDTVRIGFLLIPASLLGFIISSHTSRWVQPALLRPAVYVFSGGAALALIARSTFF